MKVQKLYGRAQKNLDGDDMKTALKIIIAVLVVIVFAIMYIAFVAGTSGDIGSFLENFWSGIISLIPV